MIKSNYYSITLYFHEGKLSLLRNETNGKLNAMPYKEKNGVILLETKMRSGRKKASISNVPIPYRKTAAYVVT